MGIKQEIKNKIPIPSLKTHAADVAITISSFHERLEIQT